MRSVAVWEAVFMLVVLKLPVVYLAAVVIWAIRAEPVREGGTEGGDSLVPLRPCGWDEWRRGRSRRPAAWRPFTPSRRPVRRGTGVPA